MPSRLLPAPRHFPADRSGAFLGERDLKARMLGALKDSLELGICDKVLEETFPNDFEFFRLERQFGLPREFGWMLDEIHVGLQASSRTGRADAYYRWTATCLEAIKPGADLTLVWPRFALDMAGHAKHGLVHRVQGREARRVIHDTIQALAATLADPAGLGEWGDLAERAGATMQKSPRQAHRLAMEAIAHVRKDVRRSIRLAAKRATPNGTSAVYGIFAMWLLDIAKSPPRKREPRLMRRLASLDQEGA